MIEGLGRGTWVSFVAYSSLNLHGLKLKDTCLYVYQFFSEHIVGSSICTVWDVFVKNKELLCYILLIPFL